MKRAKTIFQISALLLTFMLTKTLNVMQDTKEIWKDVVGYEGLYQVSNRGIIQSLTRKNPKPIGYVGRKGYALVSLIKDGKTNTRIAHRIVAKAFIDNPNNKPEVNHKDGNKLNNNINNLEWCTGRENRDHAASTNNRGTKLTIEQVRRIKYSGEKATTLTKEMPVSIQNIKSIQKGRTWKHV